jgi:hypothetical protein
LSKGWLTSSNGLLEEQKRLLGRYGAQKAERIFRAMLKPYRYLLFIDSGVCNETVLKELLGKALALAKNINLELQVQESDISFLKSLVHGRPSEEIMVIKKRRDR